MIARQELSLPPAVFSFRLFPFIFHPVNSPRTSPPLKVCLVTAGEPLPSDRSDVRLHRTGQLAAWLAARGHHVDWATNRFDHFRKIQRSGPSLAQVSENFRIHLLDSSGYRRNVSLARLRDHAGLGREFRKRGADFGSPDVVVAAMPTIELAFEAVQWARSIGAISVVDIRDLWPDVLIESAPKPIRWGLRLLLSGLQRKLDLAVSQADVIVAPNKDFLEWACRNERRQRKTIDAVFPLGYELHEISVSEREDAFAFWRSRGVDLQDAKSSILVFAGSLSRQFDFAPILDLLESQKVPRVRVVICGTGEQQEALADRSHKLPGLFVPGWCSYAQLRVLMDHAILGLMPYRDSPNFRNHIPNKAAEYLAHGLPLAWSLGTGPLDELIEKKHLGVSYGSSASLLADYVHQLQSDPTLCARIRETATTVFHERFDADTVHANFEQLLYRIARHPRTGNGGVCA